MNPPPRLHDLVAIVTGGASGFGEAIARRFAREGARVLLADQNEEGAARVAEAIVESGGEAISCRVDVADAADTESMVGLALERFGRLDIMVCNAGISHPKGSVLEMDEAFFDRLYAVNVKSLYHATRSCVPVFRRQGGGCFINIASTGAVRPRPGLAWYNGTKGAVVLITKSLAVEFAADGIRANALNPAIAETPLLTTFMGAEDTPENREPFLDSIPLRRLCRAEDVANAAVFLAEPNSEYITGVCLEVDGGRCV